MSFHVAPRVSRPSFVALVLITGTTALSTDTYIAALPQIQTTLGTSANVAQLTMTACIAGMAIGQLSGGPISDARGRRNLIIASTIIFTAMSILCAAAPSAGCWCSNAPYRAWPAVPPPASDAPSSPTRPPDASPPHVSGLFTNEGVVAGWWL